MLKYGKTEKVFNLYNCKDSNNNIVETSSLKEIPGCKTIQCQKCTNMWHVCESHKHRFSCKRFAEFKKHVNTFHKYLSTVPFSFKNEINYKLDEIDTDMVTTSTSDNNMMTLVETELLNNQLETVSSIKQEIIKNLICNSFAQDYKSSSIIDKSECQFHLESTKFCLGLTENHQNQFACLLHQVTTINFEKTRFPLDFNDTRKFYTEYKYSIYENIPCPKAFTYIIMPHLLSMPYFRYGWLIII